MANIYETTDKITPTISFHKSVAVNGGIVAKSASLGDSQCRLVVNDEGVYIIIPSRFSDDGKLSEVNYRRYSLGAMVEAIQELNRRTAWMETDMTFSESLNGTDVIDDSAVNPGALYNNAADLLPGLKQTASYGNRFMLIDTTGEAVKFYEITDEYKDVLTAVLDAPLITNTSVYSSTISGIMNDDYTIKYISPRILNVTDNSFDILLLDTVGDGNTSPSELSDKYYTYTLIGNSNYKASLKKGVTIEDIVEEGNKITPPAPYFGTLSKIDQYSVTSFAGLFKDCTELTGVIDLSEWDFSRITDMSHMFEGCSNITSIAFGNNKLNTVAITDYIFDGCSSKLIITRNMYTPLPAFIYDSDTAESPAKKTLTLNGTIIMDTSDQPVSCNGYVWKMNGESETVYCRFSYTAGGNNPYSFYLRKYKLGTDNKLTLVEP